MELVTHIVPGPPFVFGALLVILALMVAAFIPESFGGKFVSGPFDAHTSDSDSGDSGGGRKLKRRKSSSIVSRWEN